ncbi:hypothetical protein [Maridesulfovibrio sp.]|uniref:hypothetical protein n=1 Tax=Maridesulfovibrio sp. TaxID=2795000 RepID=UPI0039EE7EB4
MISIKEMQKRVARKPERLDIKSCLRESNSMARGGDALSSINYLMISIFGILKIRDLTKPEKKVFHDDIYKVLGNIDLMPSVIEATQGEGSLITLLEQQGLRELFSKLQATVKVIKNLEKQALQLKAKEKEEKIKAALAGISKELGKGNVAAAKSKADRLLESNSNKKTALLEQVIEIFAEKQSLKGWWHYLQKRYNPESCTLEEARKCANQIAKIRSLDDPENAKNWYRNGLDFRLKIWELTLQEDSSDTDAVVEACYNLAICVYYMQDRVKGMAPRVFGRELIEKGLEFAPTSSHLKKMGKSFGVKG